MKELQIKKIEELSIKELKQRLAALYPLCGFGLHTTTRKGHFMYRQWNRLASQLHMR